METSREWIERRDKLSLCRSRACAHGRAELQVGIERKRTRRRIHRSEAVAVVPIGFDRLLQRLLQKRDDAVRVACRRREASELHEDALAVVRDAADPLCGLTCRDHAVE